MIFQSPSSPTPLVLQHSSTCKSWTMFTCNSSMNFRNSCPLPPEKVEIFKSLNGWAEKNILSYLKPVEKSWQPSDFLPDAMSEECREVREMAKELPDDYLVVLVGDMITEEALPTYHSILNTIDGVKDETGSSDTSWATWTRKWTAEENRHGDLLNRYLYLSGRVDMRQVEVTIQHLISSGMEIEAADNNPYMVFTYTAFQERATFISHGNTARLAKGYGDTKLAQICGIIAADEKRHEKAYCMVMEKLFEVDPDEAVVAFANMMRKKIRMPAQLMYDGQDHTLFDHYSAVAQRIGVYTAGDYFDIVDFLVKRWHVGDLSGLSGAGREAQDYVCRLAGKLRKLDERVRSKAKDHPSSLSFSWIFDRTVTL